MSPLPPRVALALLVLVALVSTGLLGLLKLNNAPEVYLPPSAPAVAFDRQVREVFPQDDVLAVLFEVADPFDTSFLLALNQVAQQVERHPKVERVLTLTTLDRIAGTEDAFIVEPLLDPQDLEQGSAEQRRERVLRDRFAPGLVASTDGRTVALMVRPVPLDDSLQRLDLVRAVERAIETAGIADHMVAMAGEVALDVAEFESTVQDNLIFIPTTSAVGLLLIWWLYRRPLAVVLAAGAIWAVAATTLALIAIWGRPYTLVASMVPPLMAALTIALCIHLYNGLMQAARRGHQGRARVTRALALIRRPARYTALTTAAGLISLGASAVQPIQTFGVVSGLGALFLYVVVVGLLPPILSTRDRSAWPASHGGGRWVNFVVERLARLSIRRAGWVVALAALLILGGSPFLFKVEAETDLYRFYGEDHPLTQSTHRVEQALSGVTVLEVIFDGAARDSLKSVERLQALRAFQSWLNALPEVDRTLSMVEVIEEMHWAFHGEDPAYRLLPQNRALISQYLFIYDGRDLYDLVDREFQRTRLTINLNVHGANAIQGVIDQITEQLGAQPVADLEWRIVGSGRLFADLEDLLVEGQVRSLWVALGMIFLLLLWQWRSLGSALLCMLPNIAPILLIFMIMGLLGIWLDMATAMIASVAVGVAVDDTIHRYHGYWGVGR